MAATRQDIRLWFREAARDGTSTHMLVVCDEFSYEDYPVMVDIREYAVEDAIAAHSKNMQKVMEVYDLGIDMDQQLDPDVRAWNI